MCSFTSVVRKATFAVTPVTFGDCKCFPVPLPAVVGRVGCDCDVRNYQRACFYDCMEGSDGYLLINADDKRQGVTNLDVFRHQPLGSLPVEDPHAGGRHGGCGSQRGCAQATGGKRYKV